jgi:hypothetical protein
MAICHCSGRDPSHSASDRFIHAFAHSRKFRRICPIIKAVYSKREQRYEERMLASLKSRQDAHPPGLPVRRPRPLTPPLPAEGLVQSEQEYNVQTQSSFIARLPPEIRGLIYKEAIGNAVIHLETLEELFLHRLCPEPEGGICRCRHLRRRGTRRVLSPLSLLLTCRLM